MPRKRRTAMVICVCGLAGSGKSTVAKKLAEKYNLHYYSGGDTLKALAMEEGYQNVDRGWWESGEGMRFLERRSRDTQFDEAIDKKLLEIAQYGDVILDSWTMPWLLDKGFKIWFEAPLGTRATRTAKRDGISLDDALKALEEKEEQTKNIYKRLYGFRLGEDYKPFHLILDTENLTVDEVFQVLCEVADNFLLPSLEKNLSNRTVSPFAFKPLT